MAIETVTADDLLNTSLPTRGWVVEEERPVPPEVLAVVAFMEERLGWAGTATELVSEADLDGVAPTTIGRRLNEHSQALLEAGIRYSTRRTDRQRTIELEHV